MTSTPRLSGGHLEGSPRLAFTNKTKNHNTKHFPSLVSILEGNDIIPVKSLSHKVISDELTY